MEDDDISGIFNKELLENKIIGDYWFQLGKFNQKIIVCHTANVVRCMFKDMSFRTEITEFEQNVLKWAALFHDIDKKGRPLFDDKDHIHPFNSARATLIILEKLKILKLETE